MRSTNGNYLLSPVLLSQQKHYSSEELYIKRQFMPINYQRLFVAVEIRKERHDKEKIK